MVGPQGSAGTSFGSLALSEMPRRFSANIDGKPEDTPQIPAMETPCRGTTANRSPEDRLHRTRSAATQGNGLGIPLHPSEKRPHP
jgi:hypothetical protein